MRKVISEQSITIQTELLSNTFRRIPPKIEAAAELSPLTNRASVYMKAFSNLDDDTKEDILFVAGAFISLLFSLLALVLAFRID